MSKYQNLWLVLLRLSMGWMFFYAGITKVLNPSWSAEGYLRGAKTFTEFYNFLLTPEILPVVNFLNEWGLTLIGVSLILGAGVRISVVLGSALMLLYYIPILDFPYPNAHAYIVDEHIIYIFALLLLGAMNAGHTFGLGRWFSARSFINKRPLLLKLLG